MKNVIARRILLGIGGTLWVAAVLGCMSLSFGEHHDSINADESALATGGKVTVPGHGELDVYYPVPFASPPNLTVESTWNEIATVQQQADHFRIKNPEAFSREVTWKARGVRTVAVVSPAPPSPAPPIPQVPTVTITSNP